MPQIPIIGLQPVPTPSACSNINQTPANDEIMSSTPNLGGVGGGAVGPVRPRRPDTRLIGAVKVMSFQ